MLLNLILIVASAAFAADVPPAEQIARLKLENASLKADNSLLRLSLDSLQEQVKHLQQKLTDASVADLTKLAAEQCNERKIERSACEVDPKTWEVRRKAKQEPTRPAKP